MLIAPVAPAADEAATRSGPPPPRTGAKPVHDVGVQTVDVLVQQRGIGAAHGGQR